MLVLICAGYGDGGWQVDRSKLRRSIARLHRAGRHCRRTFRVQKNAASLKQRHVLGTPLPQFSFRVQKNAASLKRDVIVTGILYGEFLPRSKERGLIEATRSRRTNAATLPLSRSKERGLIEAARSS